MSHHPREEEHRSSKCSNTRDGPNQTQNQERQTLRPADSKSFFFFLLSIVLASQIECLLLLLIFLQVCSVSVVPPSWHSQRWFCAVQVFPLSSTETRGRTRTWPWTCVTTDCWNELVVPDFSHRWERQRPVKMLCFCHGWLLKVTQVLVQILYFCWWGCCLT